MTALSSHCSDRSFVPNGSPSQSSFWAAHGRREPQDRPHHVGSAVPRHRAAPIDAPGRIRRSYRAVANVEGTSRVGAGVDGDDDNQPFAGIDDIYRTSLVTGIGLTEKITRHELASSERTTA